MKKLISAIEFISIWTGKGVSLFCFLIVFAVLYEVIMRYIFNLPTLWANETMVFSCALIYVIGGAWTHHAGQHVKVDLIYDMLGPKAKAVVDFITFFFFALYMFCLLWASALYSWDSIQLRERPGSPWNPPIYPIKIALTVGICLLILQGIAKFIRDIYFMIHEKEI
jgi:TRAP-type mannitol/chloroaromatic compound transport system permease small subunit